MRWSKSLVCCLSLALIAVVGFPSAADAQRSRVRISRPLAVSAGFHFHPYYDPFFWGYGWWQPGPIPIPRWPFGRYRDDSAARIEVVPRQTEVYVDGYLAGTVDDFDGFAQRLRLPSGHHVIELYLDGHRPTSEAIYFQPGETYRIRHRMEPLAVGEPAPARPTPRAAVAGGSSPAGPYGQRGGAPRDPRAPHDPRDPRHPAGAAAGAVSIRVQPGDAIILIDGERWEASATDARVEVQVSPGTHDVEVRKDGYVPFITTVEIRPGEQRSINVSLTKRQ